VAKAIEDGAAGGVAEGVEEPIDVCLLSDHCCAFTVR
jgi:hypothetical protein